MIRLIKLLEYKAKSEMIIKHSLYMEEQYNFLAFEVLNEIGFKLFD